MKIKWPARPDNSGNSMKKSPGLANDCELAARIKEGDRRALRQLVERHIGRVRTYLLHRLGEDRVDTVDRVVALTFGDALHLIGPYATGSASMPMEFWLIRLAEKNLSRMRPDKKSAGEAIDRHAAHAQGSDLARFRAALSGIPDRFRSVLVLAVIEQMPANEIAQCMGVSPASAMRSLRTALKRLGIALDRQGAG
jgi:DNA-directed RNA polymerase specialized sigma24 family protein